MSVKRQATTELNHDNWDQDDPADHEEMGTFKTASKEILEKRVIRTAKRRNQLSGGDAKKSVFSGFGGFNKTQPSSFDFLANLTNVNKPANGSAATKNENTVTSSLFGSKPSSPNNVSGLFGSNTQVGNDTVPKFGMSSTFSSTTTSTTTSKADSTVRDNFKLPAISSSNSTLNQGGFTFKTSTVNSVSTSQVSSTIFGAPPTTSSNSMFSTSTPFKMQPVSSTTTVAQKIAEINSKTVGISETNLEPVNKPKVKSKKQIYYGKLKGLNESVSDWIKKHVEETPLCILSPIFKDYEKHLKVIQDEYNKNDEKLSETKIPETSSFGVAGTKASTFGVSETVSPASKPTSPFAMNSSNNSPFSTKPANDKPAENNTSFSFGIKPVNSAQENKKEAVSPASKSATSFGMNTPNSTLFSAKSPDKPSENNASFSFGIKPVNSVTTSPPSGFSFGINKAVPNNEPAGSISNNSPFSFGVGKPFSFNSNIQKPSETQNDDKNEDEDEPPKVEFKAVVEENSVYEKRCKIFVKKDGNFADKGVGTLFIKKVEESGKHQLLVRANTNLGNVLLNMILSSSLPTQRMGKNNVMMVCIPTPDAKPPPTPILIRVKTSEEADELLETLNKYKA